MRENAWHFKAAGSQFSNSKVLQWTGRPLAGKEFAMVGEAYNGKYNTKIKTYSEASDESRKLAADPAKKDTPQATEATALRRSALDGQLLRGTLLNTYGWWWIGTIALWAGWVLALLTLCALVIALLPKRNKSADMGSASVS